MDSREIDSIIWRVLRANGFGDSVNALSYDNALKDGMYIGVSDEYGISRNAEKCRKVKAELSAALGVEVRIGFEHNTVTEY